MSTAPPFDPAFSDLVIEIGRRGETRAAMAIALDVSLEAFDAWAAEHPDFAAALQRAETESRAFWDRQPVEAIETGKPFRASIWSALMAQRYGRAGARSPRRKEDDVAKPAPAKSELWSVEIPDNGRDRPDRKRGGA